MRNFWLILSVLWLWTCSGGDKATGPEEPPIVVNLTSLNGQAQKGPFNNGTAINVAELTNTLSPTGRNFSSAITDNTGRFAVANVQLESPYVELRANGFYFNEVTNKISDAQLTLYALSDLTGKTSLNVNILTHLEKNRMVTLMSGDNPKTFAQAKLQAQEEVLAIFDYSRANVPESELLDISQDGAANAKLLAMSAIIQGDLTVGQMSQLLANISTDIASDGILDDTNLRNTLIENSKNLDMAEVRSYLVAHYTSLGISATIPDFETEINQFLKPPVAQDMSASTGEDTPINITLAASDPEGESLTYTILEVNNATVTLNGNVATYTPNANFFGTDTFTYYANDGTSDSNIATVTMTVSGEDDDPNTQNAAATTDEDVAVVLQLTAEEYDGDSYSFGIISNPSNGSVSLDGANATYTPNQDYNGTDSFTFEATDDTGRMMNVGTATITVNAINDIPVVYDSTVTINEDSFIILNDRGTGKQGQHVFRVSDVDSDLQWPNMEFSWDVVGNGTINFEPYGTGQNTVYYPNENFNGITSIQYKATDSGGAVSSSKWITLNIAPVNDVPVVEDISFSIYKNTTGYGIRIKGDNSNDVDGDPIKFYVASPPSNGNIYNDAGGGIPSGDALVDGNELYSYYTIYNPNTDFSGNDSFTFKANDGTSDSNIATVNIEVINNSFDNVWGGSKEESSQKVIETFDGGYLMAGYSNSFSSDWDGYLVKVDSSGNLEWEQTYGSSTGLDRIWHAQQTDDGGFILGGDTENYGAIATDMYLLKVDSQGNEEWVKTFGGSGDESVYSLEISSDGGFLIGGYTSSFDSVNKDVYLIKTDDQGNEEWSKIIIDNNNDDIATHFLELDNSGYIFSGITKSYGNGNYDISLVKLDSNREIVWYKTYGGDGHDESYKGLYIAHNGYFIIGDSETSGWSSGDGLIIKTDSEGNEEWSQRYGGNNNETLRGFDITNDGSFVIAGRQYQNGDHSMYLLKVDVNGSIELEKTYGGSNHYDAGSDIKATSDGGYIMTGTTNSFGNNSQFYLVKLDIIGNRKF